MIEELRTVENEDHLIAAIKGQKTSPTIVFIGGIHGNEKAGIKALEKVLQKIDNENIKIYGNFFALRGNITALELGVRYTDVDLNRIWTLQNIRDISRQDLANKYADIAELKKLHTIITEIFNSCKGPFYFIDLHTTSADTIPFITISDSLNNRKFAKHFSVPVILGIEEYLDGPLLTYINEFGHVALGFEGGQHYSQRAVDNCEAFIWLSLKTAGCLKKKQIEDYGKYKKLLSINPGEQHFYEIDYRYAINKDETYVMHNGFSNFQNIEKGELLGFSNTKEIHANMGGKIFMPLYQKQGEDGFFIITRISAFWMQLSIWGRKLKLHNFLRILPGIEQAKGEVHTLIVNQKTAAFLATEIFHLFGYRKRVKKDGKLYFTKRDRKVSNFI